MHKHLSLADMLLDLHLFEGEGGGTGSAPGATAPVAGEQTGVDTADAGQTMQQETPEDREARFHELINGEFKEAYGKEMQKIISKRVGDTKALEQRLADQQVIMDRMAQKYGITDGNTEALAQAIDNDYDMWAQAADEAGMTTEQYVKFQALQRQNADLVRQEQARIQAQQQQMEMQKWAQEASELKGKFPDFDLPTEVQNPNFVRMVRSGVPMEHAFKVIHFDEIQNATVANAAEQTEKAVTANIRAKGTRPAENGATGGYGASETKLDVHKLTREGRQELINRARNGERISFT
jgi:hypothetical protein